LNFGHPFNANGSTKNEINLNGKHNTKSVNPKNQIFMMLFSAVGSGWLDNVAVDFYSPFPLVPLNGIGGRDWLM
jgi:hypothetical protein